MSCAILYTANTTPTAILANGTIPLGTIIRRFGRGLDLAGNGINIQQPGYYTLDVSLTAAPTAAGPITATLLKDGTPVPGGVASATAAAAGNPVNLSLDAAILQPGCCTGVSVLTIQLSAAATLTNAAVVAEKV